MYNRKAIIFSQKVGTEYPDTLTIQYERGQKEFTGELQFPDKGTECVLNFLKKFHENNAK